MQARLQDLQGHVNGCNCMPHIGKSHELIICSKVFAESWQLRSQLKTDIRSQVRSLKSLFPGSDPRNPHSPREIQQAISDKVTLWMSNGSYLHDLVPNSVCFFFDMTTQCANHTTGPASPFWASNN